ncbi:MAG: type II methionyl aminopeptidase [Chlamydiae bacterium]|nr:type II methionyl aminopeptidase [Chlamydiota bacterium]
MDAEYKKNFLHAGTIAGRVRDFGKSLIVPGASYNEVIQKIRDKIYQSGAIPAFPPQIALNFVAAHFLPSPEEDIFFSDQLIKLDLGVCYQGAIGDCAISIDLSGKYEHLISAAEEALLVAEKALKVGVKVSEIGAAIEKTITSRGLKPIRNLTGHGLGKYKVHTSPHFPNYDDKSKHTLKPGMTFAIEPFVTDGKGWIYDAGNATLFSLQNPLHSYNGMVKEVYEIIKSFKTLPFCIHDLITPKTPLEVVKKSIKVMLRDRVIIDYAPLVEEASGMVAQAEHSFLIDEDGAVIVTTR